MNRALELALLKTFCLPSISGLLHQTGEFEQRPRKRYDDTALIVAELVRLGPDTPQGQAVIQRLNRIHGTYAIGQADYAYVLSGFVAEPIRWIERYGWMPLRPWNRRPYSCSGIMWAASNIEQRPGSLRELMELNQHANHQLFACASSNQRVADATVAMLLAPWPAPFHPWLRSIVCRLLEPETLSSLNWPKAPAWQVKAVQMALHCRSSSRAPFAVSELPNADGFLPETHTQLRTQFSLEQLGPPSLLQRLNDASLADGDEKTG